uniref:Cupin type-1 domain-containing protein n=1 Tax=Chenopodium quinoa TaxID=63459 RepID=A0A803L813_CHEQI
MIGWLQSLESRDLVDAVAGVARSGGCVRWNRAIWWLRPLVSRVLVAAVAGVARSGGCDSVVSSGSTGTIGRLVKKEDRIPVVATEFGEISAVDVDDGSGTGRHSYHIQFITLEPNALFLPVLLHADMVFYVKTGSGKISWTDSDELNKVSLQRGDVYRLKSGSLFYLHSSLEAEETRLRIVAVFANPEEEKLQGPSIGPYSSINDLVRGFDKSILQAAFQVPEEVVEELTSATDTPAIVYAETKKKNFWQQELLFINVFLGIQSYSNQISENKKKHTKTFNSRKTRILKAAAGGVQQSAITTCTHYKIPISVSIW